MGLLYSKVSVSSMAIVIVKYLILCALIVHLCDCELFICPKPGSIPEPCTCDRNGTIGVTINCSGTNLAIVTLSLKSIRKPIDTLTLSSINVTTLSGPIFQDLTIYNLKVIQSNLTKIEPSTFESVKSTLRSLDLSDNKLTSLDDVIKTTELIHNLTRLNLSGNKINKISDKSFSKLKNLRELSLSSNGISKLSAASFSGLKDLESLDLSSNLLNKLERNAFKELKKIKNLDFSHNQVTELGRSDLTDLINLITFNCSHNQISKLGRSLLSRNSQLKEINLSHNQLKEIDSYLLKGVRFLKDINLQNNNITTIAKNAFSSTTRLRSLDLAYNQLAEVAQEVFKDLQYLDRLDLSHNQIKRIERASISKMYKVAIDLSYNSIEKIEPGSFLDVANVTTLDLSHNNISGIPNLAFENSDVTNLLLNHNFIVDSTKILISNLTGIKMLNLSHNQITDLNRKSLSTGKLYELETIDLSNNFIKDLTGSIFEKFQSIRELRLNNNKLRKIGFGAFGACPTLLKLDLSQNEITIVANGGLSSLISVRFIDVSYNRITKLFTIPISLNTLYLQHNRIDSITAGTFPSMNALLELYLDSNIIADLEPGSLANLLTLRLLSLRNNSLTSVPKAALQQLTSLSYLDLSSNDITRLEPRQFGSLPVVFELQLQSNKIDQIDDGAFEGLLQLIKLNLSDNSLKQLEPGVFRTCVSVRTLDLSNNKLNKLENKTHGILEDLLSLENFNVSHNLISFVNDRTFPRSPYIPYAIKNVDLSYNFIPTLTPIFDDGLWRVERLILRGNIINEIKANVLSNMTELRYLDLSSNQLRKLENVTFGVNTLNKLEYLSIAENKLADFNIEEVESMKSLKIFNASLNSISVIPSKSIVKMLRHGTQVYLHGNPISCDCEILSYLRWKIAKKAEQIITNGTLLEEDTTCAYPVERQGIALGKLKYKMFESCETNDSSKVSQGFNFDQEEQLNLRFKGFEKLRGRRNSIRVVWFVVRRDKDISGFKLSTISEDGKEVDSVNLSYDKRDHVYNNFKLGNGLRICVKAIDSMGKPDSEYSDCIDGQVRDVFAGFNRQHLSPKLIANHANQSQFTAHQFVIFFIVLVYFANSIDYL
ncbi:protein artichoke-like [Panonychus citri]|uniref:protein artichoke-like n=1 Tax=Panonychus citri TaxID=50023 RepID=UPI0023072979|nr:protein artichoke-like [Panonychus citri]